MNRTFLQRCTKQLIAVCPKILMVALTTTLGGNAVAQTRLPIGQENRMDTRPTFIEDISPIIHSKCASCHRPGQSGPFSLLTYNDVAKRARTIEAVIDSGYMPPWKPVNHEVDFKNDRRLTSNQKDLLGKWIQNGKPRGEGQQPEPPEFTEGWQLGKPDLVVKMNGRFEVPAMGPDIYRSFVFPIQLPEDKWVKAIEYRPTATAAVHHALFFANENGKARRLDGEDGKPGIAGMGFIGNFPNDDLDTANAPIAGDWLTQVQKVRSGEMVPPVNRALGNGLGAYVPGWTPNKLPGDLARLLPKNSDVVMQTHFHPSGKAEIEEGSLAIYFADRPPSKLIVPIQVPAMFGVGVGLKVPAGKTDYVISESFTTPVDIQLIAIGAHAHYICRKAKMTATLPNGKTKVLLQIDDWDLDWQDRYYFETSVILPAGTVFTSELAYDNSDENPENPNIPSKEIRWGRESGDEMGSITVETVAVKESERVQLETALSRYFLDSLTQGDIVDLLMQLDTDRDGALQKSEAPPRMASRFRLLDRNNNKMLERSELEVIRRFLPPNRKGGK